MDEKVIYFHVYNPSQSMFKANKNDKAKSFTVTCSNSENCGLFKRGECCLVGAFGSRCPYGQHQTQTGYTRKARAYFDWIRKEEAKYSHLPKPSLTSPKSIMAIVGDYVYLPYSFMNLNKYVPFIEHANTFNNGSHFLKLENFTIDNIIKICKFRPQALMGGEITDYQRKSIPLFLMHLREQFRDLCTQLVEVYPRALEILSAHTNVGRKARLGTLTPNVGTFNETSSNKITATWVWDGEYLTSFDKETSFLIINDFTEARIKPNPNVIVTITDEGQVNENTKFES